jgi:DNA-binding transcriptional ArsR family regulator
MTYRLRRLLQRTYGFLARESEPEQPKRADGSHDPRSTAAAAVDDTEQSDTTRTEADLLLEDGVTPEARFVDLMETNDGWLRQKNLVEATNLSKATVSRTLSTMEEEGAVTRRRVGRENIVYLSGREPTNTARAMNPEQNGQLPTGDQNVSNDRNAT